MNALKLIKILSAMGLASLLPLSANAVPDVGMGSLTKNTIEIQANEIAPYESNLRAVLLAIESTAAVGNDLDAVYNIVDSAGTTTFTVTPTAAGGSSDELSVVVTTASGIAIGPFAAASTTLTYTPKLVTGAAVSITASTPTDIVNSVVIAAWDCEIGSSSALRLPFGTATDDDITEAVFVLAGGVFAPCHI